MQHSHWHSTVLAALCLASSALAAMAQEAEPNPLKPLEALVGDWESEVTNPDGTRTTRTIRYEWLHDGKFLRATSRRQTGDKIVGMEITYRWDPIEKIARASVISSDGAWNEACVEMAGNVVRLHSKGVMPDGQPISLLSSLRTTGPGERDEEWEDMKIGGHPVPQAPPIHWKRVK